MNRVLPIIAIDSVRGATHAAAERRKNVAHGASRGMHGGAARTAPEGRKNDSRGVLLRPSGARHCAFDSTPRLAPWASFCRPAGAGSRRRRRGFTLPEVLVTLVLIGVFFPVVMTGVTLCLQAADDARKKEEASGLAEQKLSELTESSTSGGGSTTGNSGDFGPEHAGFTWQAQVSTVDTDLDEVRVRVSWNSRGRERGIDLSGFAYTGTGPGTSGSLGTSAVSGGGGQ